MTASHDTDTPLGRLRRPEYTGENRCPLHGRQRRDRRGRRSRRRRADRGRTRRGRPPPSRSQRSGSAATSCPAPELRSATSPGARCGCSERDATPAAGGGRRRIVPSCRPRCWSRRRTGSDLAFAPWFESAWRTHLAALRDAADAEFGASSVPGRGGREPPRPPPTVPALPLLPPTSPPARGSPASTTRTLAGGGGAAKRDSRTPATSESVTGSPDRRSSRMSPPTAR